MDFLLMGNNIYFSSDLDYLWMVICLLTLLPFSYFCLYIIYSLQTFVDISVGKWIPTSVFPCYWNISVHCYWIWSKISLRYIWYQHWRVHQNTRLIFILHVTLHSIVLFLLIGKLRAIFTVVLLRATVMIFITKCWALFWNPLPEMSIEGVWQNPNCMQLNSEMK